MISSCPMVAFDQRPRHISCTIWKSNRSLQTTVDDYRMKITIFIEILKFFFFFFQKTDVVKPYSIFDDFISSWFDIKKGKISDELSFFQFKKINHAHSILSDEKKRTVYDKHGSFGLYLADQFGDEFVDTFMTMSSKWFQCFILSCFCLTGMYCSKIIKSVVMSIFQGDRRQEKSSFHCLLLMSTTRL